VAFVRLAFFPGATLEQYEALDAELGDAPVPPERLVFVAGVRDGGLQVVQVWESREALDAFNQQWLVPALTRLGARGFPAPPAVVDFETHDLDVRPA
jgi:hypothetical protein